MKDKEILTPCNGKIDQRVSRSFLGLFMHYDNGDMINIQDLPKADYENFLEQMNTLRMAYITLISRP